MCFLTLEGSRAVMDCASDSIEFCSSECINSHLKALSMVEGEVSTLRYEEEIVVEFDENKAHVLTEYCGVIRQVEALLTKKELFGHPQDPAYNERKKHLRDFYEMMFMNPLLAAKTLRDYNEPYPEKQIFVKGYQTFLAWINGILDAFEKTKLYALTKEHGDLREAFLVLTGLKSTPFIQSFNLALPASARLIDSPDNDYPLGYGIRARVYEIPGADANVYFQYDPVLESLSPELKGMLKQAIAFGLKKFEERAKMDFRTIFDDKVREYRQQFLDQAGLHDIPITSQQALRMGREAASWIVGLGAPVENLSLDQENINDVYIDSANAPLYIEHAKFGLCHPLWRYNTETLELAFQNVVSAVGGGRKFDEKNPVIDVMLTRLNLRCHLQRPPATFGDLQGAFRLMKPTPFTYSEYLSLSSFTPFYAGYDDVMVGIGCSEAVLGLKGVGKTSFTSAKISAISPTRRILPIQDIEEIPVLAYRKRGFHIGAMRVQSSEKEGTGGTELDLVSMAGASLRMGDACLIINEIRSRLALQGVINLLNTQPGVFLLYNLHAESLRDVQDRLELVFGIPSAAMYATDRYSFLKKIRFGRKSRVYRVLGNSYETDQDQRKFVEVFTFKRANTIEDCKLACNFVENKEAEAWSLNKLDFKKLDKDLSTSFTPPALARRSEANGISTHDYLMQAFFKAKFYSDVFETSRKLNDKTLLQLDFVLKANAAANRLLKEKETETGGIDYADVQPLWEKRFKELVFQDRKEREVRAATSK